jgi:putative ABC transport system ATP-binding protein
MSTSIAPSARNLAPQIVLRHVAKTYPSPAGPFLALKDISADIYPGEFLGVIGKSGAGKSTLLNMITGVDRLTSGQVEIRANGHAVSLHALPETDLAVFRGRYIGVVHQAFHFLPMLTVAENVILPIDMCGAYRPAESRARAMALLELVELEEHADKLPTQISGGQQQRVAIARALANDPPILVADEPTGSLDSATAEHVFEAFARLVEQGKTIVMVTHDNGLAPLFSRRLYLADGEITDQEALTTESGGDD